MDPEALLVTVGQAEDHAWRIHLRGDLDAASAPLLAQELDELVGQGATLVIVDLADIDFLDSSGLRAIVSGGNALEAGGGKLVIAGMSPAAQRILEVTGLLESYRAD